MRIFLVIALSLVAFQSYCQDKDIRIGPCCSSVSSKLQPIFICDGMLLKSIEQSELPVNYRTIDSICIRKDTLFDYKGVARHYGIVELYTKDSVNTGLKYILNQTDYWLYQHPLASLKINGIKVKWNKRTTNRLMALKAENIIEIKVIDPEIGKYQDGLIKLKIKK